MASTSIKPPRLLLWLSICLLIVFAGTLHYFSRKALPPSIEIQTDGQPTLGYAHAKVHLVIFEEPKCENCAAFHAEIFSRLKDTYIDTNKIQYTAIPVSFLPGSMPAAVASLCVYHEDPLYPNDELFFKYFEYIYTHQPGERVDWATPEKLVEFGEATSPVISPHKLRKCIAMETYRVQIEKNTAYGKQLMGGTISTPTLYVNGILVDEMTYENISKLIEEVLDN